VICSKLSFSPRDHDVETYLHVRCLDLYYLFQNELQLGLVPRDACSRTPRPSFFRFEA
jgi:hypothetical protein